MMMPKMGGLICPTSAECRECTMDGESKAKALNASKMGRSEVDVSHPDIVAAWAKVVAGEASWIALGYSSKTALVLLGSGDGGYKGLRPLLADDAVVYGAFRLSSPSKLVFVASIGESAGGMVKGRATAHTQSVENALEGTTLGIQLADAEDYGEDALRAKLSKSLNADVVL